MPQENGYSRFLAYTPVQKVKDNVYEAQVTEALSIGVVEMAKLRLPKCYR
jgi:hypothetical protein|tara:strand:- start:13 stop:162 length:150 start_codon:yes stop_codon:yes gene_type:complete